MRSAGTERVESRVGLHRQRQSKVSQYIQYIHATGRCSVHLRRNELSNDEDFGLWRKSLRFIEKKNSETSTQYRLSVTAQSTDTDE